MFVLLTIGVILSFSRSISPCSKNSDDTNSATLFSTSHGFVIAAKSQTVISIALNNSLCSSKLQHGLSRITLKNAPLFLKYTAKSVDRMASSSTLMTREYSSDDIFDNNWLPGEFKIIIHWSKWWCSIVDVEYNWARGDEALIWNELLVPRWSRSWHKQAIINARHSISPKTFHHCVAFN